MGLVRTLEPPAPGPQVTTTDLSLAFVAALDQQPTKVTWTGEWFVPRQQGGDLQVASDGAVDVRVAGGRVLQHEAGASPSTAHLILGSGSHPLEIVALPAAGGGGGTLAVQWTPAGGRPRAFESVPLFPAQVGSGAYWGTRALGWLRNTLLAAWLITLTLATLVLCAWSVGHAARALRTLARWWRAQPPLATRLRRALLRAHQRWRATGAPRSARDFRQRVSGIVFPALLAPTVLFLLGPHVIYASNSDEFNAPFVDVAFPWLLALVATAWTLLFAAGCAIAFLSARLTRMYAALLFAAGTLAWIQGSFLVGDYGLLAGEGLDLSRQAWHAPYEVWMWVAVLALVVFFARRISAVAALGSLILITLQAIVMIASIASASGESQADADRGGRAWRPPPDKIYQLSRNRNVIHIVLDGFLSEIFGEIVEKERATFDRDFSGFVFFADHLGAFPTTRASMPAMLSGTVYRNDVPFEQFMEKAMAEPSIFNVLARQGFQVRSVTFHNLDHPRGSPADRVVRYNIPTPYGNHRDYVESAAAQLLDLSLFRHAPHQFKSLVYNDDAWLFQRRYSEQEAARRARPSNHVAFLEEFASRMTTAEDEAVYTFLHLAIPHTPVVVDADCTFLGQRRSTRPQYTGQARCALAVVQRLLNQLRELGAYDRSVIVVTSDHGWSIPRNDHPFRTVSSPAGNLAAVVPGAMPLLMVKPAGSSGPLRVSHAPTAITDIPATILDLLGLPYNEALGQPVLRIDENVGRPRVFAEHSWAQAGWRLPYFDVLHLFSVKGRVLDPGAWTFERAIFEPSDDLETQLARYEAGLFGVEWGADGEFRWGGPQVVTYAPPDARSFTVEARKPPNMAQEQTLVVRIDGKVTARHQLTEGAWLRVEQALPSRRPGESPFCIELIVDRSWRGADRRLRGAMYRALEWKR